MADKDLRTASPVGSAEKAVGEVIVLTGMGFVVFGSRAGFWSEDVADYYRLATEAPAETEIKAGGGE